MSASPLADVQPGGATNLLSSALSYAAEGFAVFPLHNPRADGTCSCGDDHHSNPKHVGKHPRTTNGFKAATRDVDQISRWWGDWPDANIGIACGPASGIFVLDIDGPRGEESLHRLTDLHGPLPTTRTVKTGNGRQMYFQHPGGRVKPSAPINPDFPGLDSRGDASYVVAPPSVHYSGRRYEHEPTSPTKWAKAPGWLVDFINCKAAKPKARDEQGAINEASIGEGGRNAALASLAGKMRFAAAGQDELDAALLVFNKSRCNPPLDDAEVLQIAGSIGRYAPGSPDDVRRNLTDIGNAKRFAERYGQEVRYVPERGSWLIWRGTHWEADAVGEVVERAKTVVAGIHDEALAASDQNLRVEIAKHAKSSANAARIRAMLELATTEQDLVIPERELDTHQGVLVVENGRLCLSSGKLSPPDRLDYITKRAPVVFDPAAGCPQFTAFLDRVMGSDPELIAYLQRVIGYSLSGYTGESVLFFLHGTGANGKSTLLNVIRDLLGPDHCRSLASEAIAARQAQTGATPEIARLPGARVVLTNEVEDGSFLAESRVKQMTGGDALVARHLYQAPFEFVPQFKLFIAGNHKPVVRGTDDGIWRRIHLIPFEVTIPFEERDAGLAGALRQELPGILNWAVEGYRAWRKRKLGPPPCVVEAVDEYRAEMDILGQWIETCCEVDDMCEVPAADAYFSYRGWCEVNGFKAWTIATFGRALKERHKHKRSAQGNRYLGIKLKTSNVVPIAKAKAACRAV